MIQRLPPSGMPAISSSCAIAATMIFALLLPIAMVVGMSFVFGGKERPALQGGRHCRAVIDKQAHPFLRSAIVDLCAMTDRRTGVHKVTHQQIDLLLDLHGTPVLLGQPQTRPRATSSRSCCSQPRPARNANPSQATPCGTWTGCSPASSA